MDKTLSLPLAAELERASHAVRALEAAPELILGPKHRSLKWMPEALARYEGIAVQPVRSAEKVDAPLIYAAARQAAAASTLTQAYWAFTDTLAAALPLPLAQAAEGRGREIALARRLPAEHSQAEWVALCAQVVLDATVLAVQRLRDIEQALRIESRRVHDMRSHAGAWDVFALLPAHPVLTRENAMSLSGLGYKGSYRALVTLAHRGVLTEFPGKGSESVFIANAFRWESRQGDAQPQRDSRAISPR